MNAIQWTRLALALTPLVASLSLPARAAPLPVTYQGQLKFEGAPYNGLADLSFTLYDRLVGGTPLCTDALTNVEVINGLFTVELNFSGRILLRWCSALPGNLGQYARGECHPRSASAGKRGTLRAVRFRWCRGRRLDPALRGHLSSGQR